MNTYSRWPGVGVLVAGVFALGLAAAARADDKTDQPDALRAELLKLNTAATEETQQAKLRALVKDRAKAKAAVAEAVKMMKEAKDKDEKPFNFNGSSVLAQAAHVVRDYAAGERFYEHQIDLATKLDSGAKLLQAYDGLLDLYWDAKRYADVVDVCEKVVDSKGKQELDDAKPFVLERLIQAKAKLGKFDEAHNLTKGLLELTDGSWYFLRLKGWVQREEGKFDDAIKTYSDVLDKVDASDLKGEQKDRLKDGVRYILSGLYVENRDIDKAAKQLQILVKRNPDSATYKNDLGYIWSDHDQNLEEAEKLIREALALDQKAQEKTKADGKIDEVTENAAYLDSLGWVLFKQKKYKEALPYLKKAAADEDEGQHMEIWDHLGDVLLALDQKKEAAATWEKALKMEDLTKRDAERRRKVTEKLRDVRAELQK